MGIVTSGPYEITATVRPGNDTFAVLDIKSEMFAQWAGLKCADILFRPVILQVLS